MVKEQNVSSPEAILRNEISKISHLQKCDKRDVYHHFSTAFSAVSWKKNLFFCIMAKSSIHLNPSHKCLLLLRTHRKFNFPPCSFFSSAKRANKKRLKNKEIFTNADRRERLKNNPPFLSKKYSKLHSLMFIAKQNVSPKKHFRLLSLNIRC